MANPPKQKGTNRETNLIEALKLVWPRVERRSGNTPSKDFFETGSWRIEAKHAKAWQVMAWIRKMRKYADAEWAILVKHGDTRTEAGRSVGRVAIVDEDLFIRMLQVYEMAKAMMEDHE